MQEELDEVLVLLAEKESNVTKVRDIWACAVCRACLVLLFCLFEMLQTYSI